MTAPCVMHGAIRSGQARRSVVDSQRVPDISDLPQSADGDSVHSEDAPAGSEALHAARRAHAGSEARKARHGSRRGSATVAPVPSPSAKANASDSTVPTMSPTWTPSGARDGSARHAFQRASLRIQALSRLKRGSAAYMARPHDEDGDGASSGGRSRSAWDGSARSRRGGNGLLAARSSAGRGGDSDDDDSLVDAAVEMDEATKAAKREAAIERRLKAAQRLAEAQAEATPEAAATAIREMINYGVFLILFSVVILDGRNEQSIFYAGDSVFKGLTEAKLALPADSVPLEAEKDFSGIGSAGDLYDFFENVLYPQVYTSTSFDGDVRGGGFPDYAVQANRRGTMFGANWIIGGIRIGQSRVRRELCSNVAGAFVIDGVDEWCYPAFSKDTESLEPFGLGSPPPFNNTRAADNEFTFTSATNLDYPTPGFHVVLPNIEGNNSNLGGVIRGSDPTPVRTLVHSLRRRKFIDLQTRAIFVDMSWANINIDLQMSLRLVVEFPAAGGAVPSVDRIVLRQFKYHLTSDMVRSAFEVIMIGMVIRYLYIEFTKIRSTGRRYFASGTNAMHLFNLLLFLLVWSLRLAALLLTPTRIDRHSAAYIDLRTPMTLTRFSQDIGALNAFMSWLKAFVYLRFLSQFALFTNTIARSARPALDFLLIFSLVMFASAQSFMLAFGSSMQVRR